MGLLSRSKREPQIRWLIKRDMDEVLAIENYSCGVPWTGGEFLRVLRQSSNIGVVYESEQATVEGFMVYELQKGLLQIRNIGVSPYDRRTGIGRQMIQRLVEKLDEQRRTAIEAAVSERNLTVQLFLQACGFMAVDILRNHFVNGDYILFRYEI